MGRIQQVGFIRRKNFFDIRILRIMKRCCLLLSIYKMMLFNGTSGLRKNKLMFHGKILRRPEHALVEKWPEHALVESYIGGLKDEIRSEVKLFHPTIIVHATSLARLQEDNMQRQRHGLIQPGLLPTPPKPPNILTTTLKLPLGTGFKKLS